MVKTVSQLLSYWRHSCRKLNKFHSVTWSGIETDWPLRAQPLR